MVKPDWQKGEPDSVLPGMLIRTERFGVRLVGHINEWGNFHGHSDVWPEIIEWAWAIKPHELEWLGGKEAK